MRADAARNHAAIVTAAREAFESDGPDVPLEEVARRAGVAPSTLYRRFAGRDELVAEVFAAHFTEEIEPVLRRAGAADDPGRGLAEALDGIAAAVVRHRGVYKLAHDRGAIGSDVVARFLEPLDALLARARAAGAVRDDLVAHDVPALVMMLVATAARPGQEVDPARWDRYLALVLDAMAPGARRPLPPLPPH